MFRFFLCCGLLGAVINCSSISDGNRFEVLERNPRNEALKRANGLDEIGETGASLKALSRILRAEPLDEITLEALIRFVEIQVREGRPEEGLKKVEELKGRGLLRKGSPSRLDLLRRQAENLLHRRQIDKIDKEDVRADRDQPVIFPTRTVSNSIGVVIPLSGPFKVYGERILASVRLALSDARTRRNADGLVFELENGSSVIVLDSMGLAQASEIAVDKLVQEYQVGVIIGDILSETAVAISTRAAKRDVINLSLSRKDGITQLGPKIFQMAITPKRQSEKLLTARDGNRYEKIAILYPENTFGIEMRNAFSNVARENKINVVKMVGYDPSVTTYTSYIRKLVGPKNTASSENFERCQTKANRIADFAARKKAERDCLENVVPVIGFDALFIPEFQKNLGYIVPALISEGVMVSSNESLVTSYRKTSGNERARPIQLLGPSSFNNSAIPEKLGNQIEGALFVDCGEFDETREDVVRFNENFESLTGTSPMLSEAIAYDAVKSVRSIMNKVGSDRNIDLSLLTQYFYSSRYDGLVGTTFFDDTRESNIPLNLFSYYDGKIVRND